MTEELMEMFNKIFTDHSLDNVEPNEHPCPGCFAPCTCEAGTTEGGGELACHHRCGGQPEYA